MDVLAGTAASLRVDFVGASGSLIPDANSVFWSLYDSTGALLSGPTAITTLSTDTGVTVAVVGTSNAIGGGRRFDKRFVVVTFTSGGQGANVTRNYRIVPLLNMTASNDEVRSLIGVDSDELPDEDIDLVNAYFLLEVDAGQAPLAAALASGTRLEIIANQAILGQCVVELFSGVPQRVGMIQRDGTLAFQRFASVDLQSVLVRARDMRARGIVAIQGLVETNETLMVLSHPIDPLTTLSPYAILPWP